MSKEQPPIDQDHEMVNCEVCMKSIPKSESKNAEAVDYVAYFCGLECYDNWKKQPDKNEKEES